MMKLAKKKLFKWKKKTSTFADISMFIYIVVKINICFEVNI